MAQRFDNAAIKGMVACRAAFKALPDITREALADAVQETAAHIRLGAIFRVPVRYGFLRNHIDMRVDRKTGTGFVGVRKGAEVTPDGHLAQPTKYAHLVEFGTIHIEARPFMIPSAEEQRRPFLDRCKQSGKKIERDTATIGLRNL